MSIGNLCCDEEDFIRDVPDPAGNDSQSHSWEDVGVVSLAREEGLSIGQGYLWEWTPTCKYSPALIKETEKSIQISKRSLIFLLLIMTCAQGTLVTKLLKLSQQRHLHQSHLQLTLWEDPPHPEP